MIIDTHISRISNDVIRVFTLADWIDDNMLGRFNVTMCYNFRQYISLLSHAIDDIINPPNLFISTTEEDMPYTQFYDVKLKN